MPAGKPLALVLDDDASAAEALALVLRDWGADVVARESAPALLDAVGARLGEARWIITDYHLGAEMNGVAVAQGIVADAPDMRVLVLSGSTGTAPERDAAKAGFDMMRKPAPADAILAWLDRA